MAWGRLDDKMHSHRKTMRIRRDQRCAAIGLWTLANSWCNDHSTDGLLPAYMIEELCGSLDSAEQLCLAGYWVPVPDMSQWDKTGQDVAVPRVPVSRPEIEAAEGFQFINWAEFNPLAVDQEDKRKAERDRKQKWRESKKAKSEGGPTVVPTGHVPCPEDVPPMSPLSHTHTHTHISTEKTCSSAPPTNPPTSPPRTSQPNEPEGFAAFWAAYPRRQGKGAALKAWAKAAKRESVQTLIDGATRYAADPNRDPAYTAMAATWLNGQRWDDDPLPSRNGRRPSRVEQKFADAEAMKDNPNQEILAAFGHTPALASTPLLAIAEGIA